MVDAKKSSNDYSNQMITTHGFNYVKNRRSVVREGMVKPNLRKPSKPEITLQTA